MTLRCSSSTISKRLSPFEILSSAKEPANKPPRAGARLPAMSETPPPPQVSSDGKFYWDGTRWVPMQGQSAEPPPMQQPQPVVVVKQPRGAWNSCVGYGCLAIAAVFVLAAVTAW